MLTAYEHKAVQQATRASRNAHARERRSQGLTYRKVPTTVTTVHATAPDGSRLLLATSDAPSEAGRYFRVEVVDGTARCSCGLYRTCGGCPHAAHVAATRSAGA